MVDLSSTAWSSIRQTVTVVSCSSTAMHGIGMSLPAHQASDNKKFSELQRLPPQS